jgi:hypothetical protein
MTFPGDIYAPPGVYTRTQFENPVAGALETLKFPVFVGTGNEILYQRGLEVVRGSSSFVDNRVVDEDTSGRAVVEVTLAGQVILGEFNGALNRFQVRNYPIVSGDGSGTTTNDRTSVSVTLNNEPVVVNSVDGARGLVSISAEPDASDEVRVTYFFNRTDTQITDDVSEQVTAESAIILGQVGVDATTGTFDIVTGTNDELKLTVDQEAEVTITLAAGSFTASQVAALINGQAVGTLVAAPFTNNEGNLAIRLTADMDILVGDGSANALLGLVANQTTGRNKTFFVFQRPIVDGSNGGVITTDVSHVVAKVDGVQVIPSSVDGTNGAVTLSYAPAAGSTVTVQYYFNSWQETFDYLANVGITDVLQAGITAERNDYTDGVDFVLRDDKIVWGTSALVSGGVHTSGYTVFGENQVSVTLIDNRAYLAECEPVVDTTVTPPQDSRQEFRLPHQPTTGNGRSSPLGTSLFQTVANDRIDLPTNRPDLVIAYWGFSAQDALDRGAVEVTKVESETSTLTLREAVPAGAMVWATYYYNTIQDETYNLEVVIPGAAGIGTYKITNDDGTKFFNARFGTKSAALTGISVEFPSGSESLPDSRFEGGEGTIFTGPVSETVTVTFATTADSPAKTSVPGPSPYYVIDGASDHARVQIDGGDLVAGATGIDVADPAANPSTAGIGGFFAVLMGDEIVYEADSGGTTYEIDTSNQEISLTVDNVLLTAQAATGAAQTLADYVAAINAAAITAGSEPEYYGATRFTAPTVITASEYDELVLHYNGDVGGLSGEHTITLTPGTYNSATALAAEVDTRLAAIVSPVQATGTITIGGVPAPGATITFGAAPPLTANAGVARTPGLNDFDPTATPLSTEIAAAINDGANAYAPLVTAVDNNPVVSLTAVPVGFAGNAITLATSDAISFVLSGPNLTGGIDGLDGTVTCSADASGRLLFTLSKAGADAAGYLEFVAHTAAEQDFAILAGIDTDAAAGDAQTKLLDGPIAKRFTVGATPLNHDRMLLRNRLWPGSGSLAPYHQVEQVELVIQGVSDESMVGMASQQYAMGGVGATVKPASLYGNVGMSGGQGSGFGDERDGQPIITFYDGSGVVAANNVFKLTVDGTAITVVFTATAGGTATALGPATTATTVINQIADAMATAGFGANAAAVITAGLIWQEGAGIRYVSSLSGAASSLIVGNGVANSLLGLSEGATASRTPVDVRVLSSALNNHAEPGGSFPTYMHDFTSATANYFAAEALAGVIEDELGAEYLYLQSQSTGTTSSVIWAAATTDDILLPGTGLLATYGDGNVGELGIDGFYVTSSDPVDGSGTADTSVLNSGTGQDGLVGQTYRDAVTGLTFSVLERPGGASYPSASSFTFLVSDVVATDANIPSKAIPGLETLVTNTSGIAVDDSAIVETFRRSGAEPAVGDLYYVSYAYRKSDYRHRVYSTLKAIEEAYGEVSPNNPVSLAAYLALINGAFLVGIKQIPLCEGCEEPTVSDYRDAIDDLATPFANSSASPDIIVLLRGKKAEVDLFLYLTQHCDVQSSIRYRKERTALMGLSPLVTPMEMGDIAQQISATRTRAVYPESAIITLTDALNNSEEHLIEGFYLAAALAGSVVNPSLDVAVPWTNRTLFGFTQLGRQLDAVDANLVAQRGVTVLVMEGANVKVRHGLTTDMTNTLTKLPTIRLIADEVQIQARRILSRFIGVKFLPGILAKVEGRLAAGMRQLVKSQIIAAYTGIKATIDPDNPTAAEVEAWYQPIFPLLYLVVTFHMRSSLT